MMTVCGYLMAEERHWMADSLNCESGQYGGNEPPCQRFVLSECSCFMYSSIFIKVKYVLCGHCLHHG